MYNYVGIILLVVYTKTSVHCIRMQTAQFLQKLFVIVVYVLWVGTYVSFGQLRWEEYSVVSVKFWVALCKCGQNVFLHYLSAFFRYRVKTVGNE